MNRAQVNQNQTHCSNCGQMTPNYDIVNYGSIETGYRDLCGHCFNKEVAQLDGLDKFERLKFEPVRLVDCAGQTHEFHFRTHLFGPGVALDAFELGGGERTGYQFQIIGDPEEDLLALLARLIDKIRRALSVKHIEESEYGLQIADPHGRARQD